MHTARSMGLVAERGSAVSGTIDEAVVLAAIAELAAANPEFDDVFADAAMRVQLARSAGVVAQDATSVFSRTRGQEALQLRYRSEMAEVFTDLAIDVGMRQAARLADTSV
jgi:hypothetical protein